MLTTLSITITSILESDGVFSPRMSFEETAQIHPFYTEFPPIAVKSVLYRDKEANYNINLIFS